MSISRTQDLSPRDFELPLTARWLGSFLGHLKIGHVRVVFDDGQTIDFRGQHADLYAEWRLHHPARLFTRIARFGDVGFAEGYIESDWSSSDLTALIEIGARNFDAMRPKLRASFWARLAYRMRHWLRRNHRRGSRRNIAAHYDLGNDFYRLWLDDSIPTQRPGSTTPSNRWNRLSYASTSGFWRCWMRAPASACWKSAAAGEA